VTKLNHDVLKRTDALLASIDRVIAAPAIAERVERVLQSAAPSGYGYAFSLATWDQHRDEVVNAWLTAEPEWDDETDDEGDPPSFDRIVSNYADMMEVEWAEVGMIPLSRCDCTEILCYSGERPEGVSDEYGWRVKECYFYEPDKFYPIIVEVNGTVVLADSAATSPCTAEGCECNALFDTLGAESEDEADIESAAILTVWDEIDSLCIRRPGMSCNCPDCINEFAINT
jgi:hypothetical protein